MSAGSYGPAWVGRRALRGKEKWEPASYRFDAEKKRLEAAYLFSLFERNAFVEGNALSLPRDAVSGERVSHPARNRGRA